ncbi:MAG: hypothetical protein GXO88_11530 [Chlorobi bacterium]|nr:hypothetical protein [Chlorobiota bacterium]
MAKLFLPPKDTPPLKKRVSVRMPQGMLDDIRSTLLRQGLSSRLQSQWVSEAMVRLHGIPGYWNAIAEEWLDPGANIVKQITLNEKAVNALNAMSDQLKQQYPAANDVNSKIIRTAIHQALIYA